jgi:hypothetical protein
MSNSTMDQKTQTEQRILRRAAEAEDGRTAIGLSECSASVRLTERGLGQWDQRSPFVAGFTINDAGRAAITDEPLPQGRGL